MASFTNTSRGIQLSKVSPAFLHANSTSHTWAFSAFAELIDNAYDPDVSASELLIDKMEINGNTCLIFLDNGAGMDTDHLLKMLSFGFCEKKMYEKTTSHLPIGHYGNGFKSGSMRLAKDALVFTRCQTSASIGFLSQTYLKAIGTDSVFIPIITYRLPKLERVKSEQSRNNLNAILKHSVFSSEQDLKEELFALEGSKTGTKIILSNLKRLQDGRLELDFSSDEHDIRCPEAHEVDLTSVYHRPVQHQTSEYKHSLKEYCSILFLRPRMKITIRGKRVKTKLISKSLYNTEIDSYKPTWLIRPLKITFGFTSDKFKSDDYGMMLYHRNRLIKAFEKVGYQKQPNDLGIGVVGVAQVDFLQPTHNKQDFNKDEKFNSVIAAFANKLNDYWNEKKQNTHNTLLAPSGIRAPDWLWAQCEQCLKWRRLPDEYDKNSLPDQWFCRLNPDPTHNRCEIPEEPEDEDLAVKSTYVKTFKRQKEERKRKEQYDRQKQDIERQMIREREMRQKEAELMALRRATNPVTQRHVADPQGSMNLQKALAEANRREEEMKRKLQEEKRQMEAQKKTLLQLAESLKESKGKSPVVLDKVSKLIGSMAPESSRTPTTTPQKRKIDEGIADSPKYPKRHIKEEVIETPPISNNNAKPNTPHTPQSSTKDRNAGNKKYNSGSSQFYVKVDGIVNSSKQNQTTAVAKKPPPPKTPARPRRNVSSTVDTVAIDLTEDELDYEITINEDYESDEDVKPDVDELKLKAKATPEKERGSQVEKDVKPDKTALDKRRAVETAGPEKRTAVSDTPLTLKEEVPEKESSQSKECVTASVPPATDDPNKGAESNDKMPFIDTFTSNVDKVMAVIENKIKESSLKTENKENNEESCSGKKTENPVSGGNDSDVSREIGMIDMDEEDDDDDDNDDETYCEEDTSETKQFSVVEKNVNKNQEDSEKNVGDGTDNDHGLFETDHSVGEGGDNVIKSNTDSTQQKIGFDSGDFCNDQVSEKSIHSPCDSNDLVRDVKEDEIHPTKLSPKEDEINTDDICEGPKNVNHVDNESNSFVGRSPDSPNHSAIGEGDENRINPTTQNDGSSQIDKNADEESNEMEDCLGEDGLDDFERSQESEPKEVEGHGENQSPLESPINHRVEGETVNSLDDDGDDDMNCSEREGYQRLDGAEKLKETGEADHCHSMDSISGSNEDQIPKNVEQEMEDENDCSPSAPVLGAVTSSKDELKQTDETGRNKSSSLCHRESQTEPVSIDNEEKENLQTKLQVKTELLEKSEERLQNLLENVHHLLSLVCSGVDIGHVRDIEQTVNTMIQVHLEGSQSAPLSQREDEESSFPMDGE